MWKRILAGLAIFVVAGCSGSSSNTASQKGLDSSAPQVGRYQFYSVADQCFVLDTTTGTLWSESTSGVAQSNNGVFYFHKLDLKEH
jgi:hypothetical protein